MWVATKDFPFRGQKIKKGAEVRVSRSLAEQLKDEGKIETAPKETKKKEEK